MPKWSKNKTRVGQVTQILEKRVHHGDYFLNEIPAERELAKEVGVSRETVRKAVSSLIEQGVLQRETNGRILPSQQKRQGKRVRQIAFLNNAYPSPYIENWHRAILKNVEQQGWLCRQVTYHHMDDPVIEQTINAFDAVFFMPGEKVPSRTMAILQKATQPVVVLGRDFSDKGIVSLWLSSPLFVRKLFEHLYELGHRHVACLNTQPMDAVIQTWIGQWEQWKVMTGCQGQLINSPVDPYEFTADRAYQKIRDMIARNELDCTAIFCTTGSVAMAAIRAIHDAGLQVGHDLSVCSASSLAGHVRYTIPSLTCLLDVDPNPYLKVCMDWIDREGANWVGPMLLEPHEATLFKGESAGPCPVV